MHSPHHIVHRLRSHNVASCSMSGDRKWTVTRTAIPDPQCSGQHVLLQILDGAAERPPLLYGCLEGVKDHERQPVCGYSDDDAEDCALSHLSRIIRLDVTPLTSRERFSSVSFFFLTSPPSHLLPNHHHVSQYPTPVPCLPKIQIPTLYASLHVSADGDASPG